MGPGEQWHGGGSTPSWSNPYQQPGYQRPNPYQSVPSAYPPPGPPPPPPPQPGGGRGGRRAVAAMAGVAVLAAVVVTGAYVLGDDGPAGPSADGPSPSASGGAPAGERSYAPDDPRQGVAQVPDPVVAPDWQVQTSENRGDAFDVPPDDWTIGPEGTYVGYADERPDAEEPGSPLVTMAAAAIYKDGWCPEAEGGSQRAMAGTKGAQGATGTAEAAENEAVTWVRGAYDQAEEGTLDVSDPEPFESDYGLSGHVVRATVTGVPDDPEDPCGTPDGKVVAFTFLNRNNDLATWVLVADAGVPDELDDETIDTIMRSLRPYPAE